MNEQEPKPGTRDTGAPSSPKTNEDFNKKKPRVADPQMRVTPEISEGKDAQDLLNDESSDPGDSDGNGNLINESDDHVLSPDKDHEEDMDNEGIDFLSNKGIKNPDAREL